MDKPTCPQTSKQVLDDEFIQARARLLDVAALLDRVDRCADALTGKKDFRYRALQQGLQILAEMFDTTTGQRARQLLDAWSDPTAEPRQSAAGLKGAYGAWDGGEK